MMYPNSLLERVVFVLSCAFPKKGGGAQLAFLKRAVIVLPRKARNQQRGMSIVKICANKAKNLSTYT